MKIKDLRDGMSTVDVEGEIIFVGEPREVNLRTGGIARVAEVTLKDESDVVDLSLWNEQIDLVVKGSKVRITNGYTNSYRGEIRVNVGRFGRLEVLGQHP